MMPAFNSSTEWAPVLFTPFILVNLFVLRHFQGKTEPTHSYLAIFVFILGIFVLVKGTFIVLILMVIAVVSVDQIVKSKKMSWIVPGFIISVLILWVFSNQKIGNIFNYFLSTADLIAGYKDGMGNEKGSKLGILPIIFAIGSIGFVGIFFLTVKKCLGWRGICPACILAATLFVLFQHGFTRQDPQHSVPACLSFCSLCMLVLPLMWKQAGENKPLRLAVVANGFSGIIIVFTCYLSGAGIPALNTVVQRINQLPILITQGISALDDARDNHMQLLKQKYSLPEFDGKMESSTFDAGLAEAYGYYSMIRPTLTLYAANTSKMSRRNKDYLEDASGPKTILFFTGASLDGRYPTAPDSIGLLAQKTHFAAIGSIGNLLVMERRANPLKLQFEKIKELNVNFNEEILLPAPGNGMIFTQIDILPTLAGKLFSILYKPAAIFIAVGVDNEERKFRLIRATAKEGMILSPLLYDLPAFRNFYSDSESSSNLSYFKIESEKGREWCYRAKIKVMLYKVDAK